MANSWANRDEILLNFQAITGIEDIGTCLDILEQKNWDMMLAANSIMHQDDFASASNSSAVGSGNGAAMTRAEALVDLTNDQIDLTSNTHENVAIHEEESVQRCSFGVYFKNKRVPVELPAHSTIAQVKERLHEAVGVHPDNQLLTGWPLDVTDQVKLCDLALPSGLYHLKLEEKSLFPLLQAHPLSMPILVGHGVSTSVAGPSMTSSVPVDTSQRVRADVHEVVVVSSNSPDSSQYSDAQEILSSGGDDFTDPLESLDDSIFAVDPPEDPAVVAMREPLVLKECTQPTETLQIFTYQFEKRYGPMHPLFFIGSLDDAVNEATSPSAISRQRKPIFVYIHHDSSVLSNVFCSQLLCSESVVNYLSMNFITWAWDVTFQEHRIKLLQMVDVSFGRLAKSNIEDIQADHLPVILIIYKSKGALGIRNIIQGETNLDCLMTTLITAVDEHSMYNEQEASEERERLARVRMIAEQNQAYQESLDADREKNRLRQLEEEVRLKQERKEVEEKREREAVREAMSASVPAEPAKDCGEKTCTLRIRMPDQTTLQRRFLARHTLQDFMNFLGSKDYLTSEHKILTGFPRRDLSSLDVGLTLEQTGLCPQETVFVEER